MGDLFEFKKKVKTEEVEETDNVEITTRIKSCYQNPDCQCKYCIWRKDAVRMIIDLTIEDMNNFVSNNGGDFCSFDVKWVLNDAIGYMQEYEQSQRSNDDD